MVLFGAQEKNQNGALGNRTTQDSLIFVPVSDISDAMEIACGYGHCCAIRKNGHIACCGWKSYGQLEDGTTLDRNIAVEAINLSNMVKISAGFLHTCALKSDGEILC